MIFKSGEGDDIFKNINSDIQSWTSQIPSPDIEGAFLSNPALNSLLNSDEEYGMSYIGSLYLYNNITSTRLIVREMARTVGILQPELGNVINIFAEEADAATIVINAVDALVNSKAFEMGVNALGAIPIVGWIIKIIVEVAKFIYTIVRWSQQKDASKAKAELVNQFHIPISEFSKTADESLTKFCMSYVREYNMNLLFSPSYLWTKLDDFKVAREKIEDVNADPLTKFYNVTSNKITHGIGFIPGTSYLTSALRFPTSFVQGPVYDVGEFYPTVKSLCSSVYQFCRKPGPALYSISPDKLIKQWETNIYFLLLYGEESIKKGWSVQPTGNIDKNTFLCAEASEGNPSPDGVCKPSKYNDNLRNPDVSHYGALRDHVSKLYFDGELKSKNGKYGINDIDISQSVPSLNLKNLKETQYSIMDSMKCGYINTESKNGKYIFEGLKDDTKLKEKWETNINQLVNSKNAWKNLYFLDIPPGPFKNQIFEKADKEKINPEKPGPIVKIVNSNFALAPETLFKNPKPPQPLNPTGGKFKRVGSNGKSSTSNSSALPLLAMGALGLGWYLKKKKKK